MKVQPTTFIYRKYNGLLTMGSYLLYHESFLGLPSSWPPEFVEAGEGSYGRVVFYSSDVPNLGLIEYNGLCIENGKLVSNNHKTDSNYECIPKKKVNS